MLVIYAVLACLALTQGGAAVGVWSLRILGILAAVHLVEVAVFFRLCRSAGGSLPVHLLNVFLFGVLHTNELKAAREGG
jgi:hypothetical protein